MQGYITTKQVLAILEVSKKTFYRWLRKPPTKSTFDPRKVECVYVGGVRWWNRASLFKELGIADPKTSK